MSAERGSSLPARPPEVATCGPVIIADESASRPLKLRVFDFIRATGAVSRAQVAKDLGISPGTVSTLTADLIEAGVLREIVTARDPAAVVRGRPPVALAVCPDAYIVAGIKFSSRDRTGILVDFAGNRLAEAHSTVGRNGLDPEAQIAAVGAMVDDMLAQVGRSRSELGAVGIGLPGFVRHEAGRVHWSPVLEGRDVDLAALGTDRLGVPVTIDNDANLVALAELWFGKGRDRADFTVVTTEQGVGFGVVLNHRLFRGANGIGLELGHTKVQLDGALCRCGQRGCLEAYLSDYAIAREAALALDLPASETPDIPDQIAALLARAEAGDEAARSVFDRARRYLAAGLATVVNLFDPTLLILSGGRMRYDWLTREALLAEMAEFTIQSGQPLPPLVVHEWGDMLWAHGAAALALAHVTETDIGLTAAAVA